MAERLLITGATGFIGRAICQVFSRRAYDLRLLLRPSRSIRGLPPGRSEVAVASLSDARSLRAALVGVQTIIHLASAEGERRRRDLLATDVVEQRGEIVRREVSRLIVGEEGELLVEFIDQKAVEAFSTALSDRFGDQVLLSP